MEYQDNNLGKIARFLIIAILIVLILIVGSLIYVFMSWEGKPVNLPPVNYSNYYQNRDITVCNNDSDKKKENYCKINFARISGNLSICNMLDENVTFPYLSKVRKLKLNLNAADFCFITLSKSESRNYCSQIKNEAGRIVCMEDLE